MGRLIPAGTGLEYYRSVKIAGQYFAEEEPMVEESLQAILARMTMKRGRSMRLSETTPDQTLAEQAVQALESRAVCRGVVELFDAPKPREIARTAEINGSLIRRVSKGMRRFDRG